MPFRHSCFISYARDTGILVTTFMDQLKILLDGYLAPYLGEVKVFIDKEGLEYADRHEVALARAICHSVCMIVVFTPTYGRRNFCLREYKMMEELESARLRLAGLAGTGHGLIIPVILRGQKEQLPDRIASHINYCDFSKFTTADVDISRDPEYVKEIDKIARYIYNLWLVLMNVPEDVCGDCGERSLPASDAVENWPLPPVSFPWR
jgi:hypothetical protein